MRKYGAGPTVKESPWAGCSKRSASMATLPLRSEGYALPFQHLGRGQPGFQGGGVHGLDPVVVEPGLPGAAAVLLLAVAGRRRQERPREARVAPQPLRHLQPREARDAEVEQDDVGPV